MTGRGGVVMFPCDGEPPAILHRKASTELERALAAVSRTQRTRSTAFAVAARNDRLIIQFEAPIEWLDFTGEEAEAFAYALLEVVRRLSDASGDEAAP